MMPMDPMSQYDPATEALIAQQTLPRQRVAQAMMGQQGGGMGSLSQGLMQLGMMQLGMMQGKGTKPLPTAGGPGTLPVTTPGLSTNFNNFGMGGGT